MFNLPDIILYQARISFSEAFQPPEGCARDISCLTAPDRHIGAVLCFFSGLSNNAEFDKSCFVPRCIRLTLIRYIRNMLKYTALLLFGSLYDDHCADFGVCRPPHPKNGGKE